MIQPHLVFPDVYYQYLRSSKCKQSRLPLKILVFTTLSAICAFHVHDKDVVSHSMARSSTANGLCHPNAFCGLLPGRLVHDAEFRLKQMVQKRGFTGGLRAENGNNMI